MGFRTDTLKHRRSQILFSPSIFTGLDCRYTRKSCTLSFALFLTLTMSVGAMQGAQRPGIPTIRAFKSSAAISIDGRFEEAAWSESEPISTFLQRDPTEGEPSSERTEV